MKWYLFRLLKIKNSKIRKMMERYENVESIISEKESILLDLGLTLEDIDKIKRASFKKVDEFEKEIDERGVKVISLKDKLYPENLKNIAKPPLFLFYKGEIEILSSPKIIGIVGARKATKYGEMCTKKIVRELVESECVIVSGLAQGIDSVAHLETLENNGKTVAVLGCGIDIVYPKESYKMREKIEEKGVVISEFPLGVKPFARNFPIRNRVIAGISDGIVVMESAERGGSLITASIALEENREVFAVPGGINSPMSKGCNNLIKNSQAKLIQSGIDILEELNWESKDQKIKNIGLEGEKLKIYEIIKTKMNLDDIKKEINIETKRLLGHLMELELEGYIQSLPAGYYIRKI